MRVETDLQTVEPKHGELACLFDTENIHLILNPKTCEYMLYFVLSGDRVDGYSRMMFADGKKPMQGRKLFDERQLDIIGVKKGLGTW